MQEEADKPDKTKKHEEGHPRTENKVRRRRRGRIRRPISKNNNDRDKKKNTRMNRRGIWTIRRGSRKKE